MMNSSLFVYLCLLMMKEISSQFEWISYDQIDEVMEQINSINSRNCLEKRPSELVLPEESVYQKPSLEMLRQDMILRNRTQLLHVRNLAHRNALLYSYLFQRLFDDQEPGLTYILLHNAADVTAGRSMLNGSGIYFDKDMYYPHWYKNFFNKTIPLFGPYAWRADDFYDPFNWKHQWTNETIQEEDIGAGRNHHYTSRYNHGHEWYSKWLPDPTRNKREQSKPIHHVQLLFAEKMYKLRDQIETFEFYGPPHPEDPQGPTLWTRPYFDCGRSNKWIVSAVSPIVDIYPRHTDYRHLQSMRNVAVAVTDIDFIMMDINQCSQSEPIDSPSKQTNLFAGTDQCKPTTRCEPLFGFGFRRGGYQCLCQPGYRYPPYQDGPFKGYIIEKATQEEYANNFDCLKVELYQQIPQSLLRANLEVLASRTRRSIEDFISFSSQLVTGFERVPTSRSKRHTHEQSTRIQSIVQLYDRLNYDLNLCEYLTEDELTMPGDVLHDVDIQFESQARLALTLAHFLSSFYQIVNPAEDFPLRQAELDLSEEQLIGEVLAAAGGDYKVVGVGIFFDRGKFPRHRLPYFGPYAYRLEDDSGRTYRVVDWAGLDDGYENEVWFRTMKARWGANTNRAEMTEYWLKLFLRSDYSGNALVQHESGLPLYSYAPELKHGQWFPPTFQCSRNYTLPRQWIVTYAVPFFGLDALGLHLEFKGVVRVDTHLRYLDINQCSMPHHIPNAFKGSDHCDDQSTICEPLFGRGFRLGKYKCRCRPGYEYPFLDQNDFFTGDAMDAQWAILRSDFSGLSRFDQMKCRIAFAPSLKSVHRSFLFVITVFNMIVNR